MSTRMRAFLDPVIDPLNAARQQLDQLAQRSRDSQHHLETQIIALLEDDGSGIYLQGATATALGQVMQMALSQGEQRLQAVDTAVTSADRCIGALESAAAQADSSGVHPTLVDQAMDQLDPQRLLSEGMGAIEAVLAAIGRWVVDALNQGISWVGEIVEGGLSAIGAFFEQGIALISDGLEFISSLASMLRSFGTDVLNAVHDAMSALSSLVGELAGPLHHLEQMWTSEVEPTLAKAVGIIQAELTVAPPAIKFIGEALAHLNTKDLAEAGKLLGKVSSKLDDIGGPLAIAGFGVSILGDMLDPKDFNLRKFTSDAFVAAGEFAICSTGVGLIVSGSIAIASFGAKGVGALDTLAADALPKDNPLREALLTEGEDMSTQGDHLNVIDNVLGHAGDLYYDTTAPSLPPSLQQTPLGGFLQKGNPIDDVRAIGSDIGNFALSAAPIPVVGNQFQQNLATSGVDLAAAGIQSVLPSNMPGVQGIDNAINTGALSLSQWTHTISGVNFGGDSQ